MEYFFKRLMARFLPTILFFVLGGGAIVFIISLVSENGNQNFLREVILSLVVFASIIIIFEIISFVFGDKLSLWWFTRHNRIGKRYSEKYYVLLDILRVVAIYAIIAMIFAIALPGGDFSKVLPDITLFCILFAALLVIGDIFHRRFMFKRIECVTRKLGLTIPTVERYQELLQTPQFELFLRLGEPPDANLAAGLGNFKIVTSEYGYKNVFVYNPQQELLFIVGDLWTRSKKTQRYFCIDPFGNKFGKLLQINNIERIYEILITPESKRVMVDFGYLTERFSDGDFGDIIKKLKCSAVEIQKGGTMDFDCRLISKDTRTLGVKIGELYSIGDYDIEMECFQAKMSNLVMVLAACMIIEKMKVISFDFSQ